MDEAVEDWERRWRKSVMPFAALAALRAGPKHGYALAVALRDLLGAAAPEGTLYPLLNNFERDGLTKAEWAIQESGPARKIYVLTTKGEKAVEEAERCWTAFNDSLGRLVDGHVD